MFLYIPKFGQPNNFADNMKSWPGCLPDNQANNPYFMPCIYGIWKAVIYGIKKTAKITF